MKNNPPNPIDTKTKPFNCASKPPRPRPPASKSQPNLTKLHSTSTNNITEQSKTNSQSHFPSHSHSHSHFQLHCQYTNNRQSAINGKSSKFFNNKNSINGEGVSSRNGSKRQSSEWNEVSVLMFTLFLIWSFIALTLQSSLKPSNDRFQDSLPRDTWKSLVWSPRGLKSNSTIPYSLPQVKSNSQFQQFYQNQSNRVLVPSSPNASTISTALETNEQGSTNVDFTERKTGRKNLRGRSRRLDTDAEASPIVTVMVNRSSSFHRVKSNKVKSNQVKSNSSNVRLGVWAGPFDEIEDKAFQKYEILNSLSKQYAKACRVQSFSTLLRRKTVLLVMHEASLTGAPLSVAELAEEMKKCGVKVMVVVLNKKGGLIPELKTRGIPLLDDKKRKSWKFASSADLIIAASASCASWIDGLITHFPSSSNHLIWWMMENRREYYDIAKSTLSYPSALIFLSQSQADTWQSWSRSDNLNLTRDLSVIGLSVNSKIALISSIDDRVRSDSALSAQVSEMREEMRKEVRDRLGLGSDDVLILMLSSVNPGKGQIYVLEAVLNLTARLVTEYEAATNEHAATDKHAVTESMSVNDSKYSDAFSSIENERMLMRKMDKVVKEEAMDVGSGKRGPIDEGSVSKDRFGTNLPFPRVKLLIGSMNSKSNKMEYLDRLHNVLRRYNQYSDSIIWVNATTKVTPLFSASDVYAMNAQGIGETFGRVTVEAMAFELPVIGTSMGGTSEIVVHNSTGILHSSGRKGMEEMVGDLHELIQQKRKRKEMGRRGKEKVQELYMDVPMYEKMAVVFDRVLKISYNFVLKS